MAKKGWLARAIGSFLAAVAAPLTAIQHPAAGVGWLHLNRTSINYERESNPEASSIVMACVGWVQRTFSEAPAIVEEWQEARQEWEQYSRNEILDLLERPNPYYNGTTLWKATVADRILNGTGYWIKVRSSSGRVVELWWAPESTMEPKTDPQDPTIFISHYEYSPGQGKPVPLRVEDVVRFPEGMDPANPRKGLSRIRSLFREIFTDEEAANMTASLLRNMGIPGVIIAPKGPGHISGDVAKQVKETFMQKFTGDKKGEAMVMEGDVTVTQFGFSPEQMQLRSLRGIPEERITAVLGVNAAVVGLGAGLATTKVGATLREYREEAFESTIIPMYREMASELTHQLLPDFKPTPAWRIVFDLSHVRVLQDDEIKRSERVRGELADGMITVAEARRQLGHQALPEHEVYLRKQGIMAMPAGLTPEEQAGMTAATPAQPADPGPSSMALALRRDAERLEAALAARLAEPDAVPADVVAAHYLLTAETTFATMDRPMPNWMGQYLVAESRGRVNGKEPDPRLETLRAQALALKAIETPPVIEQRIVVDAQPSSPQKRVVAKTVSRDGRGRILSVREEEVSE